MWHYDDGRTEVGPLTSAQLLNAIRAGKVAPDTPVRKDDSQWVPAMEVNGLFAAAARPVIHEVCPYCEADVEEEPPCNCPSCERYLTRRAQRREPSPVNADGTRNDEAKGVRGWVRRLFD